MQHQDNPWVGHRHACGSPAAVRKPSALVKQGILDLPYSATEFKYAEELTEMLRPPPPGAKAPQPTAWDWSLRGECADRRGQSKDQSAHSGLHGLEGGKPPPRPHQKIFPQGNKMKFIKGAQTWQFGNGGGSPSRFRGRGGWLRVTSTVVEGPGPARLIPCTHPQAKQTLEHWRGAQRTRTRFPDCRASALGPAIAAPPARQSGLPVPCLTDQSPRGQSSRAVFGVASSPRRIANASVAQSHAPPNPCHPQGSF